MKYVTSVRNRGGISKGGEAGPLLETFLSTLNKIDSKHAFDTVDREESYDALKSLVEAASLDGRTWDERFDAVRNF